MSAEQNSAKVRNELIYAAKYRRQRDYLELSYLIGLDREDPAKVNEILKEVSVAEHKEGKPLLWPLVTEASTGLPSVGYFDLLNEMGIATENKKEAYTNGLEEAFSYWSKRKKTGNSSARKRF